MLDNRPLSLRGSGPSSSDRGNVQLQQTRPKVEPDPNVQRKAGPIRSKMKIENLERKCLNLIDECHEAKMAYEGCLYRFNAFKRDEAPRVQRLLREQRDQIHDVLDSRNSTILYALDSIRIEAERTGQKKICDQLRTLRAFVQLPKRRAFLDSVVNTGEASAAKKPKV